MCQGSNLAQMMFFKKENLGGLVALLYKPLPLYLDDLVAFVLAITILLSHPNMDWMSLSQKNLAFHIE
jgi:hypothetical protein